MAGLREPEIPPRGCRGCVYWSDGGRKMVCCRCPRATQADRRYEARWCRWRKTYQDKEDKT